MISSTREIQRSNVKLSQWKHTKVWFFSSRCHEQSNVDNHEISSGPSRDNVDSEDTGRRRDDVCLVDVDDRVDVTQLSLSPFWSHRAGHCCTYEYMNTGRCITFLLRTPNASMQTANMPGPASELKHTGIIVLPRRCPQTPIQPHSHN